jgi:hypothetical protein
VTQVLDGVRVHAKVVNGQRCVVIDSSRQVDAIALSVADAYKLTGMLAQAVVDACDPSRFEVAR